MNGRSHRRDELSEEPLPARPESQGSEPNEPVPDGTPSVDADLEASAIESAPPDTAPADEPVDERVDAPVDEPAPADDAVTVGAGQGRAPLPILVSTDDPRSADPSVCPYLRLDAGGTLVAPYHSPADQHECVAFGAPRPQSLRQQELVCLRAGHTDCPRYLRGQAVAGSIPPPARTVPRIPRATVAALLILVLSAGISFGFVLQRGGIDLPVVGANGTPPVAVVTTPTPTPSAAATEGPTVAPADAPTEVPSGGPTAAPTATPTEAPTATPTEAPTATAEPTPEPTATPSPTPRRTPRPTATPRSDRYALLKPCPDRRNCWIYTVRSGDNLFSIAHYYGHPMSTIYAWNPRYASGAHLRPGDQVRMPPPTR